MRFRTHALLGAAVNLPLALVATAGERAEVITLPLHLGALAVPGHLAVLPILAVGALGGMVVDADHPDTEAAHWLTGRGLHGLRHLAVHEPVGEHGFERCGWRLGPITIWHRAQVHSVAAGLIAGVLVGYLAWAFTDSWRYAAVYGLALFLGWLSHLGADAISPTPQMLWWPLSSHPVRPHWLPRVHSGSRLLEWPLQAVLVVLIGWVVL